MLHLSSQPNPVLPQNKHDTTNDILEDHSTECRLWVPHRARGGDCLTSGQSYKSLIRSIGPNWDTNIVHKSPMRVNEIHSLVLFGFESTTGLGHTYEYSTSLTHSSQPQAKRPMFQQKTTNEIHESTYPNPPIGRLTEPRDVNRQF